MSKDLSCKLCGIEREPEYVRDSQCRKCRSETNKAKRVARAIEKGKRPYGSGIGPNCTKCGEAKDSVYLSSTWCRTCHNEAAKDRRLRARIEKGLPPLGSGRKPTCCKCGGIKENPKQGYCLACHRQNDNDWRLKTERTKKHQTGLCPCGNERAPYSPSYCTVCANANSKKLRKFTEKTKAKRKLRRETDPIYALKVNVRYFTNAAMKIGVLVKQPCEVCGEQVVDAHHDDYAKPLDVRWLCRTHHNEHHINERKRLT